MSPFQSFSSLLTSFNQIAQPDLCFTILAGKHIQIHTDDRFPKYNQQQFCDGYLRKKINIASKYFICGKLNFRNIWPCFQSFLQKAVFENMKQSWAGSLGFDLTTCNRKLLSNYLGKIDVWSRRPSRFCFERNYKIMSYSLYHWKTRISQT